MSIIRSRPFGWLKKTNKLQWISHVRCWSRTKGDDICTKQLHWLSLTLEIFFFLQKVTYSNWNKTQCITCNNTSYSIKCSDKVINSAVFTGLSFTSWTSPGRNVVMDFSTVLLSMWFQLVILFKWPTLSKDYSQLNQAPKEHLWRQKRDVSQDVCPTNYVKGLKETRCNIRVKQ